MSSYTHDSTGSSRNKGKQSLQGWLKQKGIFSTWSRYYFEFKDGILARMRTEGSSIVDEDMDLSDSETNSVLLDAQTLSGKKFTFAVIRKNKSPVFLQTSSEQEYKKWIQTLNDYVRITSKQRGPQGLHVSIPNRPKSSNQTHNTMSSASNLTEQSEMTELDEDGDAMISMMEAILDATVIADEQGTIIGYNVAAQQLFGYQREEILHKNLKILMPYSIASYHDQYLRNYKKSGHKKLIGIPRELTAQKKDGTSFKVKISLGEGTSSSGKIFIGIIREVKIPTDEEIKRKEVSSTLGKLSNTNETLAINAAIQEVLQTRKELSDIFTENTEKLQSAWKERVTKRHESLLKTYDNMQDGLKKQEEKNMKLFQDLNKVRKKKSLYDDEMYLLSSFSDSSTYQNILSILRVDIAKKSFLQFCMKDKCEECLLFLEETLKFKGQYRRVLKGESLANYIAKNSIHYHKDGDATLSMKLNDGQAASEMSEINSSEILTETISHDEHLVDSSISPSIKDPVHILTDTVRGIYETYLMEKAPLQVNIRGALVEELLSKISDIIRVNEFLFEEIEKEVMCTLNPSYQAYRGTEEGRSMINMLYVLDPFFGLKGSQIGLS